MEEKKRNKCFEFLKHFWRPMSIMIWLAILIEAIQFDRMDFAVLCALENHQRSRQLVRGVEGFGRDRSIEESGARGSREVELCGMMVWMFEIYQRNVRDQMRMDFGLWSVIAKGYDVSNWMRSRRHRGVCLGVAKSLPWRKDMTSNASLR